jgi:hypothetical protein
LRKEASRGGKKITPKMEKDLAEIGNFMSDINGAGKMLDSKLK